MATLRSTVLTAYIFNFLVFSLEFHYGKASIMVQRKARNTLKISDHLFQTLDHILFTSHACQTLVQYFALIESLNRRSAPALVLQQAINDRDSAEMCSDIHLPFQPCSVYGWSWHKMYESRSSCSVRGLTGGRGTGAGAHDVVIVNEARDCGIQALTGERFRRGRLGFGEGCGEGVRDSVSGGVWAEFSVAAEQDFPAWTASNSRRLAMNSSPRMAHRLMCRLQLDCTPKRRPQR